MAISSDGRTLAVVGDDTTIRLLDGATGGQTVKGCGSEPIGMHFLPDGRSLCVISIERDGLAVHFRDVATGELLQTVKGYGSEPYSMALSPNGRTLATGGSDDSAVRLWDIATGKPRQTLEGHKDGVYRMQFSPDGQLLACGGPEGAVYLWG